MARDRYNDGGLEPVPTDPGPAAEALVKAWAAAPVPKVYGTARVGSKVVWSAEVYDSGSMTCIAGLEDTHQYQGLLRPVILSICQTPVTAVTQCYKNKQKAGPSNFFRLNAFTPAVVIPGSGLITDPAGSVAWDYLVGKPAEGQKFVGMVQYRTTQLVLDMAGDIPGIDWEVQGTCYDPGSGSPDADPADVMADLVADATIGLGIAWGVEVDHGPDGATASSFRTWCKANGFRVSRAIDELTPAGELIQSLAEACHSDAFESEGKWKVYPRGTAGFTANGATYSPPSTAIVLDEAELGGIVRCRRRRASEVKNVHAVRFQDRARDYTDSKVDFLDDGHAASHKIQRERALENAWIKTVSHAYRIAQLRARESIHCGNTFEFTARPVRWGLIETGDMVAGSDGGHMLPAAVTCRVESSIEQEDGSFLITAREWPSMVVAVDLTPAASNAVRTGGQVWSAGLGLENTVPGAIGAGNLLRNSSFESDVDADGKADGWQGYTLSEAVTLSLVAGGIDGGFFQRVAWSGANTTRKGLNSIGSLFVGGKAAGVRGGWRADQWYVLSCWAKATLTGGTGHLLTHAWNNPPNEGEVIVNPRLTTSWQRYIFRFRWTGGATLESSGGFYLTLCATADGVGGLTTDGASGYIDFDAAQVTEGFLTTDYGPMPDEVLPGTITSPEIGTGTVSADATTGGQANTSNLWPNPSSEYDPPANAPASVLNSAEFAFRVNAGAGAFAGNWVREIPTGAAATVEIHMDVPASPGQTYAIEAQVKRTAGGGIGAVRISAHDASGTSIQTQVGNTVSSGTYALSTAALQMPAGTVTARLAIVSARSGSDTTCQFDAIQARMASDAVAITPGTGWSATISSVRKLMGLLSWNFKFTAGASSAFTDIATLPAGSLPLDPNVEFLGMALDQSAGTEYTVRFNVSSAGLLTMLTPPFAIAANDTVRGTVVFPV